LIAVSTTSSIENCSSGAFCRKQKTRSKSSPESATVNETTLMLGMSFFKPQFPRCSPHVFPIRFFRRPNRSPYQLGRPNPLDLVRRYPEFIPLIDEREN
jgi:hypothetical protein